MRGASGAAALGLAGALLGAVLAAAGTLPSAVTRGKEIYVRGTSPGGEITAQMGGDGVAVPASALPCANCHGLDGRGRPEGGVVPSDLTWRALTKPYSPEHHGGRRYPPYTEKLLKRAIAMGVDPAGNPLHIAMPRYRMSHRDMADLVAYLGTIGAELDPGLRDDEIRIGVLLPPPGPLAMMGEAIRETLAAHFAALNAGGGIYGRAIALRFLVLPSDPTARAAAVASFVDGEEIFALGPSFFAGADRELAELARQRELPAIAPFTFDAAEGFPVNRQVFHLWSGLADQGRALARFAAADGRGRAAILHLDGERFAAVAAAIADELARAGWEIVEHVAHPPGGLAQGPIVDRLRREEVDTVFLLDSGPATAAFLAAADGGWRPRVLMPGSLAGPELLAAAAAFAGRIYLAYPTLPSDRTAEERAAVARLLAGHEPPPGHATTALTALAGARLLTEGIKRSGRDLSRERLISSLEELYDWQTGLTQPLTYGANRRIGARGAHLVALDPAVGGPMPAAAWVDVGR